MRLKRLDPGLEGVGDVDRVPGVGEPADPHRTDAVPLLQASSLICSGKIHRLPVSRTASMVALPRRCGRPVETTAGPAVREVEGDHDLRLVPPDHPGDLAPQRDAVLEPASGRPRESTGPTPTTRAASRSSASRMVADCRRDAVDAGLTAGQQAVQDVLALLVQRATAAAGSNTRSSGWATMQSARSQSSGSGCRPDVQQLSHAPQHLAIGRREPVRICSDGRMEIRDVDVHDVAQLRAWYDAQEAAISYDRPTP